MTTSTLRSQLDELAGKGEGVKDVGTVVLTLREASEDVARNTRNKLLGLLGHQIEIITVEVGGEDGITNAWQKVRNYLERVRLVVCVNAEDFGEATTIRQAGVETPELNTVPTAPQERLNLSRVPVVVHDPRSSLYRGIMEGIKERRYFLDTFGSVIQNYNTGWKFSLAALKPALEEYFRNTELTGEDEDIPNEISVGLERLVALTEYINKAFPNVDINMLRHLINNILTSMNSTIEILRRYVKDNNLIEGVEKLLKGLQNFLTAILNNRNDALDQPFDIVFR